MDTRLLDALRNASSLDLYELNLAINQMLSDPKRIFEIRRHLHLGAKVMYFDHRRSALAHGHVLQLQPILAIVQDDVTHTQWKLPYTAIVADPASRAESAPDVPHRAVDLTAFKIGDSVSFTDKHLREHVGTITRMNDKTYSLSCDGERWRVSPRLLRKIIDV